MAGDRLHALLVRATAGKGCEHEIGTTRRVIVVVQGDTEQDAQDQALRALSHFGWIIAEILRQAPITADVKDEPGYLGRAVKAAIEHGFQIVVYDS